MQKENKLITTLTIVGITMMAGMGTLINPIMQKLITMYPDTPVATVRTLSTICSILGMAVSLPMSLLFGKKLKYKPIMLLSALLTMGGMIPGFFDNPPFALVMASRVSVGIGFGLVTLRNACIRKMFAKKPEVLATWLGLASAVVTITSCALSPIAGLVGDVSVKYTYFLYGLAIVPFLLTLFLFKEPEDFEEPAQETAANAPKGKLNPKVLLYSAIIIFGTLISFPIFTGMATLITSRGIGEAAVSGTVISCYSLGQAFMSSIFGLQYAKMKKWAVPFDLALLAIGFGLIVIAQNVVVAIIGAFLCGAGFISFSLVYMKWAGDISDSSTRTFATTLLTTSISIGSFFSTYWITFANKIGSVFAFLPTDAERTYVVGAILYVGFAIVLALVDTSPKSKEIQA